MKERKKERKYNGTKGKKNNLGREIEKRKKGRNKERTLEVDEPLTLKGEKETLKRNEY